MLPKREQRGEDLTDAFRAALCPHAGFCHADEDNR